MRWDHAKGVRGAKDMGELAILKTLAAFMNSDGGMLIVGVEDNGNILGVEEDFQTFSDRKNWDGWMQHLVNVVRKYIGSEFLQHIVEVEAIDCDGKQFESTIPFRVLDRITKTKRIENLDLITNAEITQTIMDLKTFGAVPNNKIILNGNYEVGIIDDEIPIKMTERKVLKKVVCDGTQKVSYYTSSGKYKKKEQKIEITPKLSEVRLNRKPDGLIYVPKWIITIKAGEHTYNRKALAASNTFILDEIAFCPNHSALGKIWSRPKQTSAVCEICVVLFVMIIFLR
jgi:hypothetical protein